MSSRAAVSSVIRPRDEVSRGSGAGAPCSASDAEAAQRASGAVPAQLGERASLDGGLRSGALELLAFEATVLAPELGDTLARHGIELKSVRGDDELLACLVHDASVAPRLVGILLAPEQSPSQAAHVAHLVRRSPGHESLPILLPRPAAPAEPGGAAPPSAAAAAGAAPPAELAEPLFSLSLGSYAELESQLPLLLELHRARTRALWLARQLERSQQQLAEALERGLELEERGRGDQAELEASRLQLVQASKLSQLGELVAGVAHEINNPLSFALSHLATIRSGLGRCLGQLVLLAPESADECARLEERVGAVGLGLTRIKSLVVKLGKFSRLDDGQPRPVRVSEAIDIVLAIVQHRMEDRIDVSTELSDPAVIQCDPSLFDQCLMNLVVNAIDAIEEQGSIVIRAGTEGERYVLRVIDSGQGVPVQLGQRVFEPFFTTKPAGKGTGLGLSIAAAIVKKHGGTLQLQPGSAGGTEAVVNLPLAQVVKRRAET